jgi:hypothetical protein
MNMLVLMTAAMPLSSYLYFSAMHFSPLACVDVAVAVLLKFLKGMSC